LGDKNIDKIKYIVALGGCQTTNQDNNLPKIRGFNGEDIIDEIRQREGAVGEGRCHRVGDNRFGRRGNY
jgi:hypothetical protein